MQSTDPEQSFEELKKTSLQAFVKASEKFGEPIREMAYKAKTAFDEQATFIFIGYGEKSPPDNDTFGQMIKPLADAVKEVQVFRERNRNIPEYFNHLSTVSESIGALSWITVKPAPVQFLKDMRESGEYFGNRVLSSHKGEPAHVDWVNKWYQVLRDLETYVKTYHRTGFSWGGSAEKLRWLQPYTPAIPAFPPPPPPPPIDLNAGANDEPTVGDSRTALLNQLNQGVGITRMLKPVRRDTDAQQPASAQGGAIPRTHGTLSSAQARPTPPPKCVLDGVKWRVEYQKNNPGLTIRTENMSESLAMYHCEDSTIEVKNKMNNISIDNCKKTLVSLRGVISSVDLIRCKNVKLQLNDHVPLINIDNCECIQFFVTENARKVQVISSNSTSCNICLLKADGDYDELPIPEQIRTIVFKNGLKSDVVKME